MLPAYVPLACRGDQQLGLLLVGHGVYWQRPFRQATTVADCDGSVDLDRLLEPLEHALALHGVSSFSGSIPRYTRMSRTLALRVDPERLLAEPDVAQRPGMLAWLVGELYRADLPSIEVI